MKLVKYENNDSGGMQNLPYEKFISYGAETLTDSELLAIIIRTGTQEMSARDLGEEVLKTAGRYGNGLLGLYHIPLQKLMSVKGIGKVKSCAPEWRRQKLANNYPLRGRPLLLVIIWSGSGMKK